MCVCVCVCVCVHACEQEREMYMYVCVFVCIFEVDTILSCPAIESVIMRKQGLMQVNKRLVDSCVCQGE